MITNQVSENELTGIIRALQTRKKKKQKRAESWFNRKENGSLIIPVEVADSFITIDCHSVELITPLIERLQHARTSFS